MTDQPASARFQALLECALQEYEKTADVTLADTENSLAIRLQRCHSVDDITTLLQDNTHAFDDFQQRDKIYKTIKATVSILTPISALASAADGAGMNLLPHAKAINSTLGILLNATNGVITSFDALAKMLELIHYFINRLRLYAETSEPMSAVDEIVIKLMVELMSTLGLVAQKLEKRRSLKWVKNFFGVHDINKARQRLDHLLQEEGRAVGAQTLKAVAGNKVSTDGVQNVLARLTRDMSKLKRDKLLDNIKKWLSPPDPWENFNTARESRHSESGTWFIRGKTLSEWKGSGPSSLLWINGKPGAGKSVLCSAIIEEIESMKKSGLVSLAIFYHDFREDRKKHVSGFLSSMLFQLSNQSDSYYNILSDLYSTHHNGGQSPADDKLFEYLIKLLKCPGARPVYLIIDALDECPSTSSLSSPREKLLSFLEDLVEAQLPNLRICATSRPEVDIKAILEPLAFRSVSLHDEDGQKQDIIKCIESFVVTNKNMQNWNPDHKQLVIDVLTEKADGMFRWVECQLAYLAKCFPRDIQVILNKLPATLDETYERTLRGIEETKWESARQLLVCVAVASHPLRVEELAEILAFDFKSGAIPKFHKDWRLQNPVEAILSACSTLLSIVDVKTYLKTSRVVQFTHFTVKEFLTSSRFAEKHDSISHRYHISMSYAHTFVAQACLGMLLHLGKSITSQSLTEFPLAKYAAEHWFKHARFEGGSEDAVEGMKLLFDCTKPHFSIWIWIHNPMVPDRKRHKRAVPSPPCGTPLHYAAFCGLHKISKILAIEHTQDVNSQGFDNASSPLHLALHEGHVDLARMLVECGADPSAQENDGWTALHFASGDGHVDLARMLIEHGADVSAQDEDGSTALHLALKNNHVDLARLLINRGADVSLQTRKGWTPLFLALHNDHVDLARMLVERGADVLPKDKYGSTALHLASENHHVDLARMLMERGADVSAQTEDGSTALHLVAFKGHVDLARMLVEHNADISAQTEDGFTALYLALRNGHVDLARMLIEHGTDLSAQSKNGVTALHLALSNGDVDLTRMPIEHSVDMSSQTENGSTAPHFASHHGYVDLARLLIERGADLSVQTKDGWTALHFASLDGHVDLVRMLVEHNAEISAQTKEGWTPLHLASQHGYIDVTRILVGLRADISAQTKERHADMPAQSKDGWTALHLASCYGHVDLARILVERGADVSAQKKDGWTALHLAFLNGNVHLAQMLIEHGVDMSAQTEDGSTALHLASRYGYMDLARIFVEHRAGISQECHATMSAQTKDGSTALHLASLHGHADLVQMLVENGADVSAQDKHGWTALHLASRYGHVDLAQILVEHDADTLAKTEDGSTVLHLASLHGHVDLIRILVEHGADISAQDKHGWTALHLASRYSHMDLAQILIEHGADISATTEDGCTVLHLAFLNDRVELQVVRMFVDHGASVSAPTKDGWTALHIASRYYHVGIVRMLIERGADVSTETEDGWTALHMACRFGNEGTARLLIESNADILARTKDGSTALQLAFRCGHINLAWIFTERGTNMSAQEEGG